jgi:hypothetical protein
MPERRVQMKKLLSILVPLMILMGASAEVSALDYTADLSLDVSERYNDNIFLSRSNKVRDFITVITPAVSLSTRTQEADMMINYIPTFNIYSEHDENNGISHQVALRGQYKLSDRLTIGLSDAFIQSKDSLVLRTVEASGPIINTRQTLTTNVLIGDLSYRLSGPLSLQAAATYAMNNVAGTDAGDYMTYAGRLGINYILNEKITLRATSIYTLYDYRITGDANSMDYTLGANWRLTPTITLDGYGGVVIARLDQTGKTFTGFSGGLSVAKRFERGVASLSYVQGVSAAIESSTPLRSQVLTLLFAVPVTAEMDASLAVFYGRYKSLGDTGSSFATERSEKGGTVNIAYRLWRNLSAILSYSYVKSDDKATGTGSYVNNIIMLGLRISKQAKF